VGSVQNRNTGYEELVSQIEQILSIRLRLNALQASALPTELKSHFWYLYFNGG
jgi:hypothetical protein